MRAALLVLAIVPACYSPQLERCTVRCSAGDTCPNDMLCGDDHHCHEPNDTIACQVDRFTLTVKQAGTGDGLVTGMPQINCPPSCSETVDYGTTVALTATASSGSRFVGWGGACTGSAACSVNVDADKTVNANFALVQRLTVELMGNGGGDVRSISPQALGFDCVMPACTLDVDQNTSVTLQAVPDGSSSFIGWDGACASFNGDTCTVVLTDPLTAIAYFN
jgi:hypothetical protein